MISLRAGKGKSSDNVAEDHIVDVNDMVRIGSGAMRQLEDIRLSRYVCNLIV